MFCWHVSSASCSHPNKKQRGGGARRSPPDPGVLQELTASRDFPCFVQVRPPFSPTKGKKKHPLVLRESVANRRHIVLARAGCATYSTFAGLGTPAELHRREDFRGGGEGEGGSSHPHCIQGPSHWVSAL